MGCDIIRIEEFSQRVMLNLVSEIDKFKAICYRSWVLMVLDVLKGMSSENVVG